VSGPADLKVFKLEQVVHVFFRQNFTVLRKFVQLPLVRWLQVIIVVVDHPSTIQGVLHPIVLFCVPATELTVFVMLDFSADEKTTLWGMWCFTLVLKLLNIWSKILRCLSLCIVLSFSWNSCGNSRKQTRAWKSSILYLGTTNLESYEET